MSKNCLTCKHEPEWGEWQSFEKYTWCIGDCRWNKSLQKLPAVFKDIYKQKIIRYDDDDSGIPRNCPTWEPKED